MIEYLVKCDGNAWVTVSKDDLYSLRALYPEMVFKALDLNGKDITAQVLTTMREELIYG